MSFDLTKFNPKVAYLSMGAYLESYMPTYSGGLEVLAGDIFRSSADLRVPLVGVIQASNGGYFRQRIDDTGWQHEDSIHWSPKDSLTRLEQTVQIQHNGGNLEVGAEVYEVKGLTGYTVPIILLDTDFDSNDESDKGITGMLYSNQQRIAQENVLGQAGVKLLRKLGYKGIETFHMNEGHAAFATLEVMKELGYDADQTRKLFVFTTHTPVDAGHDKWNYSDAGKVAGGFFPENISDFAGKDVLNTTKLALSLSRYVSAVSRKHAGVCRSMDVFDGREIDYITNGIHLGTWVSPPMKRLFDGHFSHWRLDPRVLEDVVDHISPREVLSAIDESKRHLIGWVNANSELNFDTEALTIVWARRFTSYKRPGLIYHDLDRLHEIAERYGKIQLLFAGKAHPEDMEGKKLLQQVFKTSQKLQNNVRAAFIPGYDTKIAKRLLAGADVWLNTPRRPEEASGTSGIKAAVSGGLNLTTYDGWPIEGVEIAPEGIFILGPRSNQVTVNQDFDSEDTVDANGLYDSLEQIADIFHRSDKDELASRALHAISLGAHFNSHRVVRETADKAWNLKLY